MNHNEVGGSIRFFALCAVIACIGWAAGCSTKMETGYQPHSLSASPAQRRGYYASPFSPEAEAAAKDKGADQRGARPSFGGM